MSGIVGVIQKNKNILASNISSNFEKMIYSLKFTNEQIHSINIIDNICFGNVIPISQKTNTNAIVNKYLGLYVVIDGFVFVNEENKGKINSIYNLNNETLNNEYIPFLYDFYKNEFVHHITGSYNIFIYNSSLKESILINDRLGFLPLFYFENYNYFIFASKIETILVSDLVGSIKFDFVSISEHLFFNYIMSDYTYIKGINTLQNSTIFHFSNERVDKIKYWDINEFFGLPNLNKKDSFDSINSGIKEALNKILINDQKFFNFSLTGGWDSRIVLSYLIPDFKHLINSYSFGVSNSSDITVPTKISSHEEFNYTPFILDNEYLENSFPTYAENTILLSNGTRNYKRAHYIYAISQIIQNSDTLITGIFGDEVFKVGKPEGGGVISNNTIQFIESDFDINLMMKLFKKSKISQLFKYENQILISEFENRLSIISKQFQDYQYSGEKYFAFRFNLNLRKYFGNEANSYNDFVYCHSPFIDYDFLKTFARTKYMGSRFEFKKPTLKMKAQSSWLYYQITKNNNYNLTKFESSRGFSMKDTNTLNGLFKIFSNKILNNNKVYLDSFNTLNADKKFNQIFNLNTFLVSKSLVSNEFKSIHYPKQEELLSLLFWMNKINTKYIL
ncbi:MAG: hypothetical protein WCL51_04995 [Bacteroidota bacterium]